MYRWKSRRKSQMASTRDDPDMAGVKEVLVSFRVLRQWFFIVQVYTTLMEEFLVFVRVTAVIVSAVTIDSLLCTKAAVSSRFAFDADSNLYGVRVCIQTSCALLWGNLFKLLRIVREAIGIRTGETASPRFSTARSRHWRLGSFCRQQNITAGSAWTALSTSLFLQAFRLR